MLRDFAEKEEWQILSWHDGKEMYNTEWNGNKGSLIYAEGMFYCYDENDGDVGLVKATPEGFYVVSSFKITRGKGKFWAHPSISDGLLDLLSTIKIRNRCKVPLFKAGRWDFVTTSSAYTH